MNKEKERWNILYNTLHECKIKREREGYDKYSIVRRDSDGKIVISLYKVKKFFGLDIFSYPFPIKIEVIK